MSITEKRLIDEYFLVQDIDMSGQFFKRVSRIKAKSKSEEVEMELDVNFDIYPIEKNTLYRVLILRSLGISQEQDQVTMKPEIIYIQKGEIQARRQQLAIGIGQLLVCHVWESVQNLERQQQVDISVCVFWRADLEIVKQDRRTRQIW